MVSLKIKNLFECPGQQLDLLQREQQRPGEQVVGRVREAGQEPLRDGQVTLSLHSSLFEGFYNDL